ncbi:MAG: MoaD/ThiS family protein [SAR202 cluster bacterium]|jgi:molybdopterin converting factor subunit 1|nr:MoaD/ThiS family protein [Dehalococcoidia bacterium]MQF89878.1 MoaD/ThiS family protein [SAR202 cluster bacterium]|tara:strand:+ start:8337 stop:8582 length:246 start_codon:yes stop_codon:yes gene_type:complete
MELNVRLYALYRERAGGSIVSVTLPDGATVADLTDEIRRQIPNLAPPEVKVVVAVNTDYADSDMILQQSDDVCLIPPVSGG